MGRPSASFAAAEIGVLYLCKQCGCLEEIDFAHGHPPGTSKIVLLLYIILANLTQNNKKISTLTKMLGSIVWVTFWVVYRAVFWSVLSSVFHPAERINNAVTIPRFHPWNRLAINKLNEQQLTDLLAVDYLTSSVEKCVEITLEVNVSISKS